MDKVCACRRGMTRLCISAASCFFSVCREPAGEQKQRGAGGRDDRPAQQHGKDAAVVQKESCRQVAQNVAEREDGGEEGLAFDFVRRGHRFADIVDGGDGQKSPAERLNQLHGIEEANRGSQERQQNLECEKDTGNPEPEGIRSPCPEFPVDQHDGQLQQGCDGHEVSHAAASGALALYDLQQVVVDVDVPDEDRQQSGERDGILRIAGEEGEDAAFGAGT